MSPLAGRPPSRDGAEREAGGRIARVIRRILGAPDYERYVAHRRAKHPGEPVMSRDEFVRDRQAARYERPGARCC
ncbi:MAG TPA: YbdD/YjiX family protein [Gemmatimonadaceae bacterium]|nr:YbdD/YjiX family protein [Gemmatimonadaceae bacterium]